MAPTEKAIRALLLDVLDQCQLHMDACPNAKERFARIGRAATEELMLLDARKKRTLSDRNRLLRVQQETLDWMLTMQRIRQEYPLVQALERLPEAPQATMRTATERRKAL